MELRDLRGLSDAVSRAGVEVVPYRIVGTDPGTHLGLPSPTVTLIVDLHDGLALTGPGLVERTVYRCGVGDLHLSPYTIHHAGTQIGVQVNLTPGAVRRLFGVPVGALSAMLELDEIDAAFTRRLRDAVGAVDHAERRRVAVDILGEQFVARSTSPVGADPDAVRTWQEIMRTRGRVTVSELVEQSGWSARKLTGVFNAEFGMGPKQAARLIRFDAARAALESDCPASDVAVRYGYADQAHLSREFAGFTGRPPGQFLETRRRDPLTA